MPRRPVGLRALTPAERQKAYRERKRTLSAEGWDKMPVTRSEVVRMGARPRPPGARGVAEAAASQLVALKIEAIEAERRAQEQMDDIWHEARAAIAQALHGEGERTQLKRRADVLLRDAIKVAAIAEDDLKPEDVWGRRALSTHRAR